MTYGTASITAKAEYIAESAFISAEIEICRYCKAARTRAEKAGRDIKAAACKSHKEDRRLAFVTSPVSETYWAS